MIWSPTACFAIVGFIFIGISTEKLSIEVKKRNIKKGTTNRNECRYNTLLLPLQNILLPPAANVWLPVTDELELRDVARD
jgi:hypothetical protein